MNFMREVACDTELGGVPIPGGATMMVNLGSANHDETRWDDPESFDIFRERKPHIGFGRGAHVCLGMHLARLEMNSLLSALVARVARIEVGTPSIAMNNTICSFASLPVTLHAA